jgi:hypothetical protein
MPIGESPSIALDELINLHEPLLCQRWADRKSDRDVLLLGDVRSPEFARISRDNLGTTMVDEILASAKTSGRSPWLVCSHGPDYPALLRKAGGFENRSLASSLEGVARSGSGLVPLLVFAVNRVFSTAWSPPGRSVVVDRVAPPIAAETN